MFDNKQSKYPIEKNHPTGAIVFSHEEAACPKEIQRQFICIDGDIGEVLKKL